MATVYIGKGIVENIINVTSQSDCMTNKTSRHTNTKINGKIKTNTNTNTNTNANTSSGILRGYRTKNDNNPVVFITGYNNLGEDEDEVVGEWLTNQHVTTHTWRR
jgi:hypothetical protein